MPASARGLTAFVNARLLDPASGLDTIGGVLVDDEAIADLGPHVSADQVPDHVHIQDCKGLCLAPGLVDMRVQLGEPGQEHKETLRSAGEAAVAGGVTAMVCLPNTTPVIDTVATMEFVARRARQVGLAKVYPYAAVTVGLDGTHMTEIGMLAEAGAVGFTDGVKAVASAQTLRMALSYASNFGQRIIQHPEEPSLAEGGAMNAGAMATRLGLSGIPVAAEAIMLARDMRLVEMTGGAYHAAHVSTAEGLDIIRRAKDRGLSVTCDTAPPYFALNELEVGDYRSYAKLSPPLRAEEDRLAVIEGLKDGTIDAIASDHTPQDQDSKRQPFAYAAFGGIGLETLLSVTMGLVHDGALSLMQAIDLLTAKPAGVLGLTGGRLRKGGAADLILFDPDRAWVAESGSFRSKSQNSPFDDRPMQGLVLQTLVDGRTVHTHPQA